MVQKELDDLRSIEFWRLHLAAGNTISGIIILYPAPSQLQDTATYLVSEAMVVTYLNMLKNSMWTNGQLRPAAPPRSAEEMEAARQVEVITN